MEPILEKGPKNLWVNENPTQLKRFTRKNSHKKNFLGMSPTQCTVTINHSIGHTHVLKNLSLSHHASPYGTRGKLKHLKLLINFHLFC